VTFAEACRLYLERRERRAADLPSELSHRERSLSGVAQDAGLRDFALFQNAAEEVAAGCGGRCTRSAAINPKNLPPAGTFGPCASSSGPRNGSSGSGPGARKEGAIELKAMPNTENTVRFVISSTFRDMHAERTHLVTVVFRSCGSGLETVGPEFFDVELRWGGAAKDLKARPPTPGVPAGNGSTGSSRSSSASRQPYGWRVRAAADQPRLNNHALLDLVSGRRQRPTAEYYPQPARAGGEDNQNRRTEYD